MAKDNKLIRHNWMRQDKPDKYFETMKFIKPKPQQGETPNPLNP